MGKGDIGGKGRLAQGAELKVNNRALTATMLRLGHTAAKVLGTNSFRPGSGLCHPL